MLILCEYCDIRCICYDDWMEHLLSKDHQEVISQAINSWDSSLNQRSLIVTLTGVKPEKVDICWYFASYGLVCDAFFESDLEFCVIQLDKKDYAERALKDKHCMEKSKLSVRLKTEVSDSEWLLLNSMVRRNATKDMVQQKQESFEERHGRLTETLKSFPLDYQIERFEREIKMNSVEISIRQKLVKEMNHLFGGIVKFPKCVLCPYGTFVTGLGSNSSLLHIYFDAIGETAGKAPEDAIAPFWRETFEILQNYISSVNRRELFCYDFVGLPRDQTPSIKFIHYLTGVKCRFTFDSLLPVRTSKLIALVMRVDARLPALFLFIKYWGEYHKLSGPKLITNYSLNLLVLVFLIQKKIVPSLTVLQSMSTTSTKVGDWETTFCEDIEKITNLMSFFGTTDICEKNETTGKPTAGSVLQLVADFCKLYAHSDLQSLVVCPSIGELIPKLAFQSGNEENLPKGLETYKSWASGRVNKLDTKSLLCIQDPFILKSNVSTETPEDVVWRFQFVCADTVDTIDGILASPNPNLMDVFHLCSKNTSKEQTTNKPATAPAKESTEVAIVNESLTTRENNASLDSVSDDSPVISVPRHIQEQYKNNKSTAQQIETTEPPLDIYPIDLSVPPPGWNQYPVSQHPPVDPYQSSSHSHYSHVQPYEASNEIFQQPRYLSQYENPSGVLEPISSPELFPQEFTSASNEPLPIGSSEISSTSSEHRKSRNRRSPQPVPPPEIKKFPMRILKFGKFEHSFTYSPNNEFFRRFKRYFGNLVIESALKVRLKTLWCIFMDDFLSEVYSKSFPFRVEEIDPTTIVVNYDKPGRITEGIRDTSLFHSDGKPSDPKRQKKEEVEVLDQFKYPPQSNPLKHKFFDLRDKLESSKAFICRVNSSSLYNREKIRSKAKSETHLLKKFPNPIAWEGEISRRTFEQENKDKGSSSAGKFVCKVTMDASSDRCVTVVFKCIQGDSRETIAAENVADHVINVFRDLVPRYQNYRLNKWLDYEKE